MSKNKIKQEKAITLIALVVTIIVLLILAGVSIAVLTGENGILNRATEAKKTNEEKTAEEELKLGIVSLSTDYYSKTTRPSTFREFIFTEESEADLNKYLSGTATFNTTNYTITYKNVTYQVAENGTLSIAEGLVLLDTLTLINGVDTSYQLTAEQKNINATNLTWDSSNKNVATVGSTTGLVTVVGAGETKITVSGTYNSKNYTAECDVTVSNLTVELGADKEVVIGGNETLTPTITPASVASREDITINWTSSVTSVATVNPATGASTTVSVPSEASANSTSTITVTIKKGTTTLATDTCIVKAITSPWIDSSYVNYNVAYTDVYTGTEYKANTGWRLLTDVSGTEYTGNIEIISTGIPAGLRYNWKTIASASWAGTEQQRKDYLNTTITDRTIGGYNYSNRSYSDYNIYVAAGLLRNFGSIVFSTAVSVNSFSLNDGIGGFVAISNNDTALQASNSPTGEDLFKIAKTNLASGEVTNIRSVNLWDIKGTNDDSDVNQITASTDKREGLFRLDQYTPVPGYSSTGYYWLASPYGYDICYLDRVSYDGYIGVHYTNAYGVRPVISITGVKMQLNGNVWQIVSNSGT